MSAGRRQATGMIAALAIAALAVAALAVAGVPASAATPPAAARAAAAPTAADNVEIVPDGVRRVRWRFASPSGRRGPEQDVPVSNNVAVAPRQPTDVFLAGATWYAADGTVVPTSDRALRRAVAARQAALKRRLIRSIERHPHRASPALLADFADFAVFSVTSRSPVREPGGITVARPRLAAVPLAILQILAPPLPFPPTGLDFRQIRAIATRSGDRMWLIPGAHGLCLAVLDRSPTTPFSPQASGAGASCSANLAQAEAGGAGLSSGHPGGATTTYGVLPRSRPTITVRINGRRRIIRPPFGVYVLDSGHGPGGPSAVAIHPVH